MNEKRVAVLGAGFVGTSCALHLARRGWDVTLIDKGGPANGASYGNAGIIQREAVSPYAFPRSVSKIAAVLFHRGIDIRYHATALPGAARALLGYWWNSSPARHARATRAYATLIAQSLAEHGRQVDWVGGKADALIRRDGWYDLYRSPAGMEEGREHARGNKAGFGIPYEEISGAEVARIEPHLLEPFTGAIYWPDTWTVRDPGELNQAYADAFLASGGRLQISDIAGIAQKGDRWVLTDTSGAEAAAVPQLVVATGAWTGPLVRQLGYHPPVFVKRGYHRHFHTLPGKPLNNWVADLETGFLIAPMKRGIRLTTGAELGRLETPKTPVQVTAAEKVARRMFPLGEPVEPEAWMGGRPCTSDMLPVIGPAPDRKGLWYAFGHGHQGLTMGPATGRLMAEMMEGETPYVDPAPFAPARFH